MVVDPSRRLLVGRARELDRLLEVVGRSDGGVVVVRGDPGIGKTTLAEHAAAGSGRRVVRVAGVQSEAVLPFSALADLLADVRPAFAALPQVQRDALEISLALRAGPPGSPLTVCAAALGVLAAAAEEEPLLVLVDDLPWIDAPSRQVLMFVARRVHRERVAMLLTGRDEVRPDPGVAELPALELRPLPDDAGRELVRALAPRTSAAQVAALVRQGHGNPLALVEGARAAGPAGVAPPAPLPSGSSLQDRWSAALDDLPAAARTVLAVLALSRSSRRADLDPVLDGLGVSLDDLAPARGRALVRLHGNDVVLRHGLLHPVVIAATPRREQRRILRCLADHAVDDLAVWYLAGAAEAPDDAVAERLAENARAARDRSGPLAAMRAWERSAELTSTRPLRAERLLAAASDAQLGGRSDLALAWCEEALDLRRDPVFLADVERARVRAHTWLGRPHRAVDDGVRAADAVRSVDPGRAERLYAEVAVPCAMVGDVPRMLEVAERVRSLGADGQRSFDAVAIGAHALTLAGRGDEARRALDEAESRLPTADPLWDAQALTTTAQALSFGERFDVARPVVDDVVATARRAGAPLLLGYALLVRTELDTWAGRWAAAYADACEALGLARELGQVGVHALAAVLLARIDAARGDSSTCHDHAEESLRTAGPHGIDCLPAYVDAALGADALASGDADTAAFRLEHARERIEAQGMANPVVVPLEGDLVEAWLRSGDRRAAQRGLDRVAEAADRTGSSYAAAVAARARGLLATDHAGAEAAFADAAVHHDRLSAPFERARTLLCHAETRRRWRRPALARPILLDALSTFATLGARPWAERARGELAAAGHRGPVARSPVHLDRLSPQEFQIARMVAEGSNNVETAAALFLSRKTVEAHLTRVYRKLGVRSRTELAAHFVHASGRPAGRPATVLPRRGAPRS